MHSDRGCTTRAGLAATVIATSLALASPATPAEATAENAAAAALPSVERLAGGSRVETAVAVARAAFPSGARAVYLVRADVPADALAAGALTDGPVLLVPSCGALPPVVRDEIARVAPDQVVALGGTAAVCESLLAEAAAGRPRARLAGADRIGTAGAIARRAFPDGAEAVYLASTAGAADAVVAGALTNGPILLVPETGSLPLEVDSAISDLRPRRVVAIGGRAAIPDTVLEEAAGGRITGRLAGPDRFATAARIATHAFPRGAARVYLARADDLADAVVAGTLTDGPVLLVPACGPVPPRVASAVTDLAPRAVVALGGPRAVCDLTRDRVADRPAPPDATRAPKDVADAVAALAFAEGTIRAGDTPAWTRAAATLQQVILRDLVADPRRRQPVYDRLPPELVAPTRAHVAAGADLRAMVRTLKPAPPTHWRIVAPAPADELLGYYREAARASGVPWQYLAAIHLVETRMGRIVGTSTAGAQGPMQFMPATWAAYGEGDVYDDRDAILAAGRYLAAHGAPRDMARALYAYNHDQRYVRAVTTYAEQMATDPDVYRGYHQWQVWYLTSAGDVLLPEGWRG